MKKTKRVGPDQDGLYYRIPIEEPEPLPVQPESTGSIFTGLDRAEMDGYMVECVEKGICPKCGTDTIKNHGCKNGISYNKCIRCGDTFCLKSNS